MTRSADVVVIGAGIIGCGVAYYLAAQGVRNVIVLERDQIARGSTADAAGGIRLQFSTETNIRLSQVSLEVWEHARDVLGIDINFRQQGYLFLVSSEEEAAAFQTNLRTQQRYGVAVRWVTPAEIRELNPVVLTDDIVGGTFCPKDGWADTYSSTIGFAQRARGLGVEIIEECPVTGIGMESGRITQVKTSSGDFSTETVVICAGAQTNAVGQMVGVDLPIQPYRRMSFITEPFDAVPATVPMTIDFASGLYFHPESHGFLFGMSNPEEPSSFNKTVDDDWMLRTVEELCRRAPVFEEARVLRGWAGFYEITPDDNPLLGQVEGVDGLFVAAGFSGHGFMQGPAVGMCMAELVAKGRAETVDISGFAPSRFREGRLAQEHNVV